MYTLLYILLILLVAYFTDEGDEMRDVKQKYKRLREYIKKNVDDPRFTKLVRPTVITGFRERYGELGYNTNKGGEIGLCVDGDANTRFHVFLHELAHSTVKSYEHNDEFWDNLEDLKDIAEKAGVYKKFKRETFCGSEVGDYFPDDN